MVASRHERPLTALLGDLLQHTGTLIRKEAALARAEIAEKVSQASGSVTLLVVGGAIAFAGLLVLLDAAVLALVSLVGLPPALAALIVGLIVAVIGLILVRKGRRDLRPGMLAPDRTIDSLRRDTELAKEQVR